MGTRLWRCKVLSSDIIRLIVIEESANDAEVILNSLRKARFPIRPTHIEDEEDLSQALADKEWDLVIAVAQVADFTLARACELILESEQDLPLIGLTDPLNEQAMVSLLGAGAARVIPKNNEVCLQIAVRAELDNLQTRRDKNRVEQLWRESQRHNRILLETSRDAIAYVHDGMHIHANPTYLQVFGFQSLDDLAGLPIMDLVASDCQATFKEFMREYMATGKDVEEGRIELTGLRTHNQKRAKFKLKMEASRAIYEDEPCIQIVIREQSASKEEIERLKRLDQLTGVFNRQYFMQLIDRALGKALNNQARSVLVFIMLDNWGSIREKVGIGGTDPILQSLAQVFQTAAQGLPIGRFGEYQFAMLMQDHDVADAEALAPKMLKAVENHVAELPDGQTVITTASIGIAQVLASSGNPKNVVNDAHAACREAQTAGGNRSQVFKAVVKTGESLDTTKVANIIETAIQENRLFLHYQPIVSLRGEAKQLYELFLRMTDAEGNPVPPGELFKAADQANLTIKLDQWVLKEGLRVLHQRQQEGEETHFFIKLSDQAVRDPTLVTFLTKVLRSSQLPGELLTIEIAESTAISHLKFAKAFITNLQKMGVRTAIEHFGTGLNSETTLKHLPVDYVKLDSSYAKGLASNPENQNAVKELVQLAHNYEKLTVAEAVEDANSLTILWQSDVDLAQGMVIQEPGEEMDFAFDE